MIQKIKDNLLSGFISCILLLVVGGILSQLVGATYLAGAFFAAGTFFEKVNGLVKSKMLKK